MKKIFLIAVFILPTVFCFSQEKGKEPIIKKSKNGIIKSIEFPYNMDKNNIPNTSDDFFKEFLEVKSKDKFKKINEKQKKKEFKHELFEQYYNE